MMRLKIHSVIPFIVVLVLLAGVSGGCAVSTDEETTAETTTSVTSSATATSSVSTTQENGNGTLQVMVTDAPPEKKITSVIVTVAQVQVHRALAEQEQEQDQQQGVTGNQTQEQEQEQETQQDGGEWITIDISEDACTFDLLLITGVEQFLGTSDVEAGKYTQIRLVLEDIKVGLEGEEEPRQATVPSNELKLVHPFSVIEGETTVLVIDFDAEKMVNITGAGKIIVKPVVKLIVRQGDSESQKKGQNE